MGRGIRENEGAGALLQYIHAGRGGEEARWGAEGQVTNARGLELKQ